MPINLKLRKGMILLQTLVMSIILAMIAVMVMQWVLGRYSIVTRGSRSNEGKAHTQGHMYQQFSASNFNAPPSENENEDTKSKIVYTVKDTNPDTHEPISWKAEITTNDEQ